MQGANSLLSVVTYPVGAGLGQRIVIDGPRGAIFEYNASNQLVGSWASKAGTDPYGNSYPEGFDISEGSIAGVDMFVYSGTPALGNLIASIAGTAGADNFGNVYEAGVVSYLPGSTYSQLLNGILNLASLDPATRISGGAELTVTDATTDGTQPAVSLVSPGVTGRNNVFLELFSDSKNGASTVSAFLGTGLPVLTVPFTVQGPITFGQDGISQATITTDGSSDIVVSNPLLLLLGGVGDTFHAINVSPGYVNGWLDGGRVPGKFRLVPSPANEAELIGSLTVPAGFAAGQNITNALPAAYRPQAGSTQSIPARDTSNNNTVWLSYGSGGVLTFAGPAASTAAGHVLDWHGLIALNA